MKNKYFDLKIVDDKFVVTNSSLTKINPDQGGTPQAFKAFYEEEAKQPTPSMEMGKMIHLYQENPDEFIVSDLDKPTDGISKWVEEIVNAIKYISENEENKENYFSSPAPTIKYKGKDTEKENEEFINCAILFINSSPDKEFLKTLGLESVLSIILISKEIVNYDNRLTTIMALEKLKNEGLKYYEFLNESNGRIILKPNDKERIENTIKALHNHPKASELLFSGFNNGNDYFTFKEHYIIYNKPNSNIILAGLIDNFQLDFTNRICLLTDLKTTSNNPLFFPPNKDKEGMIKSLQIDRQIAYYDLLIKRLISGEAKLYNYKGEEVIIPTILPEDKNKWKFYRYVVVGQTIDFHKCVVVELSQPTMFDAINYISSLLIRINWHIDNNEWQYNKEEIENNYTYKL
jgi:hypothetical protein